MTEKNIIDETYEFVESALPQSDITVNIEKTIVKKSMAGEIDIEYAEKLINRLKKSEDKQILAYYQPHSNAIVINNLKRSFDDIIKVIDHEYIHAVLDGLGLHTESTLLDKKHGRLDVVEKGGI